MTNGIVNVYKEKGWTSFDVVAKLRGVFSQRKIGHTGTLDPDAEGVLPVCLGNATKLCELLTDHDKVYEAVMLLGVTTDTQDISGEVLSRREAAVTEAEVRHVTASFVGELSQVPPMYSALKVNGQKLCDLARSGVTVERKARTVVVHSIEILELEMPRVKLRVHCGRGTYIRTLCQDIGEKLGCGGCMESLVRTRVADFCVEDALTPAEIGEAVAAGRTDFIRPVDSVFMEYPRVDAGDARKLIDNGNRIPRELVHGKPVEEEVKTVRLYDDAGTFIGLYALDGKDYRPVRLFFDR